MRWQLRRARSERGMRPPRVRDLSVLTGERHRDLRERTVRRRVSTGLRAQRARHWMRSGADGNRRRGRGRRCRLERRDGRHHRNLHRLDAVRPVQPNTRPDRNPRMLQLRQSLWVLVFCGVHLIYYPRKFSRHARIFWRVVDQRAKRVKGAEGRSARLRPKAALGSSQNRASTAIIGTDTGPMTSFRHPSVSQSSSRTSRDKVLFNISTTKAQ